MSLTYKDLVTTILAAAIIGFSYLMVTGYKLPLIPGYRWGTLVLLFVGIGMCALSSATPGSSNAWTAIAATLGIISMILITAGLIFGTKEIFLALGGTIILLWLSTTLHHLVGK